MPDLEEAKSVAREEKLPGMGSTRAKALKYKKHMTSNNQFIVAVL